MIDDLTTLATHVSFTSNALIINLPGQVDALALIIKQENLFALWAKLMDKKFALVRSHLGDFKIPASLAVSDALRRDLIMTNTLEFPSLYLGSEIKVYGSNFLRMLLELIERKDENAGIARLRDNKQLILTAGSARAMGVEDATPLTNLRREDYWNLEDLANFDREWRQQLRVDGTNSIEFTYRALDNPLDPNGGWVQQTTRYSLFVDGTELYHRAQALDVVAVHR